MWQTDVTRFPEFGRLKYVHVMIDTFYMCIFASTLSWFHCTGEHVKDVQVFRIISCPLLQPMEYLSP